jgi:BTB And C-terminal Kelch
MIASETFTVSVVLRLLDHCHGNERVCRAALFNLEARVGNQICLRNYSSVWLDLGIDVVTAMLSDSRFGYPEAVLFGAAEAWLMARPERRQTETCTAVLKCIRYPLLPKRDLYDVQRSDLVRSNVEASALVLEAMRFRLFYDYSTDKDREHWSGLQFKIRAIPKY